MDMLTQIGTPAARRAAELVERINAGDRARALAYVQNTYTPHFLELPLDLHLKVILCLQDQSRGVEVYRVQEAHPSEVTLVLRHKLCGWTTLVVRTVPDLPHRISGLEFSPAELPADAPTAKALSDTQKAGALEQFVLRLAKADVFSGAVLLAKNGETLFKGAYGEANKDFQVPNRVDTKFNLGSMNKMFTAVAIAQLVEGGQLSFDDPLARYLPGFPTAEAAEKIKIKHLLTHTSGLGNYFNQRFIEASRARFRTVDDMLQLAENDPLAFEPGTGWQYSNTGFLVLGSVIEHITGHSYFDYVRQHVYQPAGMLNTDTYELDRVNPNLAVGYEKDYGDRGIIFKNNLFEHVIRGGPAGGGYSTVDDLLRFSIALRSHRLVGPDYTRLLLAPKPDLNSPEYGYGFSVDSKWRIAGHGGGFVGISSNLDMFLDRDYTSVVLSNYGNACGLVVMKIRELVLPG